MLYSKRLMTMVRVVLLVSLVLGACGGKGSPPGSSPQHELDKRHCTANSECASGLCSNGRCG